MGHMEAGDWGNKHNLGMGVDVHGQVVALWMEAER